MDEDTISKALQYDSEHVDTYWLWQLRVINAIIIGYKKFPLRKQIVALLIREFYRSGPNRGH
jgi:hypothetical protein